MSTDWREKEREFLDGLVPDTGRDLAQWMALIAAQGLPHRNDIIDWLRHQGFTFSRASWLERIHHNGGRPIYLDPDEVSPPAAPNAAPNAGPSAGPSAAPAAASAGIDAAPARPGAPPPTGAAPQPAAAPHPSSLASPAQGPASRPALSTVPAPPAELSRPAASGPAPLADVLSKAKAYRALATYVLRELEVAIPGLCTEPLAGTGILLRAPAPFAILAVSGKDLRLALALSEDVSGGAATLQPVKLPATLARSSHAMTGMFVLTDVRQVDDALIGLAKRAAELGR